jgi:outer membrane protein OmpA-like peptidoglycan-associated protein
MKKIIASVGAIALCASGLAVAGPQDPDGSTGKKPSKEESVGMLSGVLIGAAAGGPVGAFAGLVAGAWVGGKMSLKKQQLADTRDQLAESQASVARLSRTLIEADNSIAQLSGELTLTQERLAYAQAGLPSFPREMQESLRGEVLFRTNESAVREDTSKHLTRLAGVLATTPGATVQLDAYADPRGSDDYNVELALRRAEAVRDALVAGGLAPERISINSHGEEGASSTEGDLDGYALDRRVVITIGSADVAVAQAGGNQ